MAHRLRLGLNLEVGGSLNPELRQTLRHAAGVAVLRAIETVGGLVLITLIPRIMGPAAYGQFTLLHSLSLWFSLMSGMGTVSIMTRYVPEYLERNDRAGLTKLASGLMGLRSLGGAGVAFSFTLIAAFWLRELDLTAIAIVGLSAGVRSAANLPFTVLLGMNQAARWAMAEVFRRGLLAPAVYAGFWMDGLRGACSSLLVVEVAVLAVGLWWGREFLSWSGLRADREFLKPFLKFSAGFFLGNLVFTVFTRMGGPLVKLLAGSYADVAHFSVAYGAYLTGAFAMTALFNAVGPRLSAMRVRGEMEELQQWVSGLMTAAGIASVLSAAVVFCFAEKLVGSMLGTGYEPVAALLRWLCFAGVLMIPGGMARVLSVVHGQSKVTLMGSSMQLVVFGGVAWALFPTVGIAGIAVAIVVATGVFSAYAAWAIARDVGFPILEWLKVVGIGLLLSPVVWGWSDYPVVQVLTFGVLFLAALTALRIVRHRDLLEVRKVLPRIF